jgi:hypothetical protein
LAIPPQLNSIAKFDRYLLYLQPNRRTDLLAMPELAAFL